MYRNNYSPLLPQWKVDLIKRRARRLGFRRDDLDDLQQQIVPHLLSFTFDPANANGASEETALVTLIDNQLITIVRAQSSYRRHVKPLNQDDDEETPPSAIYHESPDLTLDVQQAMAALSPRERTICTALSEGRPLSEIAQLLQCDWHTVQGNIQNIRAHFQNLDLEGWIEQ
ncbi:MAG: hypothetical protein FWD61_19920 [Phycisphaerales bacterium]|nr:hypothetical protein [Phycisphaerales bacterium]